MQKHFHHYKLKPHQRKKIKQQQQQQQQQQKNEQIFFHGQQNKVDFKKTRFYGFS